MALTTLHPCLPDEHFYIKSKGHKVPGNSKREKQPAESAGASGQTALCEGEAGLYLLPVRESPHP